MQRAALLCWMMPRMQFFLLHTEQCALKEGDPVFQGESLVSGPDSGRQIQFTDGSTLALSDNSRVALNPQGHAAQNAHASGIRRF